MTTCIRMLFMCNCESSFRKLWIVKLKVIKIKRKFIVPSHALLLVLSFTFFFFYYSSSLKLDQVSIRITYAFWSSLNRATEQFQQIPFIFIVVLVLCPAPSF